MRAEKAVLYFYEWPSEDFESKSKYTNAPGSENKGHDDEWKRTDRA
jgi:hypothetical protein